MLGLQDIDFSELVLDPTFLENPLDQHRSKEVAPIENIQVAPQSDRRLQPAHACDESWAKVRLASTKEGGVAHAVDRDKPN